MIYRRNIYRATFVLLASLAASACLQGESGEDLHLVEATIVYSDPDALPDGRLVLTITDEVGDATPLFQRSYPFTGGNPPQVLTALLVPPSIIPPTIDVELLALALDDEVMGTAVANDVTLNPGTTTVSLFVDVPRRGGPRVLSSAQLNGNPLVLVDDFSPAQIDCRNFGQLDMNVTLDDPESDPVRLSIRGQFASASVGAESADGPHAVLGPVASNQPQTLSIDFGQLLDANVKVSVSAYQVPPSIRPEDGASFDQLNVSIDCRGRALATPTLDDSGGGRRFLVQEAVSAPATPHALYVTATDDGAGFAVYCDASFKGPDGPATPEQIILDVPLGDFVAIEPQPNGIDYLVHYRDPNRPNADRSNASAIVPCLSVCNDNGLCAAPEVCGVCADCGTCDADGDATNDLLIDWSFEEGRVTGAAYDHSIDGSHDGISVGSVTHDVPGFRGNGWLLEPGPLGEPAAAVSLGPPIPIAGNLSVGLLHNSSFGDASLLQVPNVVFLKKTLTVVSVRFSPPSGDCVDTVPFLPGPVFHWVVATWNATTGDAEVWSDGVSDGPTRCAPGNLVNVEVLVAGAEVIDDQNGLNLSSPGPTTIDEVKMVGTVLGFIEQCALWGMGLGEYHCL